MRLNGEKGMSDMVIFTCGMSFGVFLATVMVTAAHIADSEKKRDRDR